MASSNADAAGGAADGHVAGGSKRQSRKAHLDIDKAPGAGPSATGSRGGQRFQCLKCPKSFSRIENLTRHQANHDDAGRFTCLLCRKRFTRSDLLNRHRKIHATSNESSKASVAQIDFASAPSRSDVQLEGNYVPLDRSMTGSNASAGAQYRNFIQQTEGSYPNDTNPSHNDYQNLTSQDGFNKPQSTIASHFKAPGPASLLEAALAPQRQVKPAETINPALWAGFMLLGDQASSYMGPYDADISWALGTYENTFSPGFDADLDRIDSFDMFPEPQHQQLCPIVQISQPPISTDTAEIEDDDEDAWPDKDTKSTDSHRRTNRVGPLPLAPMSWTSVIDEARASGLSASTMRPMQIIPTSLRQSMLALLNGSTLRNEIPKPEISDALFPPIEVLDFFLRLYIQYIQPRFPVIHLMTFDIYATPPLLLVVMMLLGSSHSRNDAGRFLRLFHDHLRLACVRMMELDPKFLRTVENILTYFLLCLAGTWSGSKRSYEFAEGARGVLITACRRARLLDCRPSARVGTEQFQRQGQGPYDASWLAWIETEKRKRLGISIYIFDCQYPALFNNQAYVSKAETTNCVFPCREEFWEAPNADTWKILVGQEDMPPSIYHLHALNSCLLRKWVKPAPQPVQAGDFGALVLMYALHTHIFEWRQATSMLNPTGLMGAFGKSAHDMGNGLRERRKWLVDGLDSWAECYGGPSTPIAANLLHRLGYISLDVSLSDMHLVAGRSNSPNDGNFAEQNLKYWANSEIAGNTMANVYSMLQTCHQCIEADIVADSSYEIMVCLFTGGIVCWAYAKLKLGNERDREYWITEVMTASKALGKIGSWNMGTMFGRILDRFGNVRTGA